jgi:DEAD/DEAH box helicase domain-containing protein
MIPSVLASQLQRGVEDFLRATFPISTPHFDGIIERLLDEGGVFKGPYLSIQLPFRQGEGGPDFFPEIPLKFKPYLHQEQAFRRLSSNEARSTIVATGTGSGKTESFLFPILDYCLKNKQKQGIKAILIYPMNALATDQATRLAQTIWDNPNLKGHVTAGLYVGQREQNPHRVMDRESLVTDKESMRLSPPDILLTNYKMLDYLLIRPNDYRLWKLNVPETLRYLVVDELHTFDGAQGTDLACLIRRLKERVKTPKSHLCCVGTSATLGSGDRQAELRDYAEEVFSEPFDENAIITESRISAGEFLETSLIKQIDVVPVQKLAALDPDEYPDLRSYISAQHELWFGEGIPAEQFDKNEWRVALGGHLKEHLVFQNLLKILGGRIRSYEELFAELEKVTPNFRGTDLKYRTNLLNSLLALVSEARLWQTKGGKQNDEISDGGTKKKTTPFLHVRVQLWLRELRRIVAEVKATPDLHFFDDLNDEQLKVHLPIVHCRECGSLGWAGIKRQHESAVQPDLKNFYIGFFNNDPKVVYLFPDDNQEQDEDLDGEICYLCPNCLHVTSETNASSCSSCGEAIVIRVFLPNSRVKRNSKTITTHDCPYCSARNGLNLLGSRAASLTSVLISQLYSSGFNDDKKLLTFSDSVQDAAHRAGFFGARTYRFNFRSALQQYVQSEGKGLSLDQLPNGFIKFWSDKTRMKPNEFIATFLAPNMEWLPDFAELKETGRLPEGSGLRNLVERRISWEIFSEYGFTSRIGRTLEKTGSSVIHLDTQVLDKTVDLILEVLRNEIGELQALDELTLRRFIVGLAIHLKEKGGVYHPDLDCLIEDYGNVYRLGKMDWLPNFSPLVRSPIFLTSKTKTRFELLTRGGSRHPTWCDSWLTKSFGLIYPMINSIGDRVYKALVALLVKQGVLSEHVNNGFAVWGLKPDVLKVSTDVHQLRCEKCSHNASVEASVADLWDGAPCLRYRCNGHYAKADQAQDYYSRLYANGDVERIFAEEHTGLLERKDREEIERQFKAAGSNRFPWNPNLLSCTPTLELGIDIGDLSSIMLCSVPPAEANYLQRIGRAGRRDGNALSVTVANAKPHDLYHFADPREMIEGRVASPGVFLNASAVLERQLTAFSLDRWVESGISPSAIPPKLGQVLGQLTQVDVKRFPYNFLDFVGKNERNLFEGFVKMFESRLSEDSIQHLKAFLEGDADKEGNVCFKIVDGLRGKLKELKSLTGKVRLLSGHIRQKEGETARDQNYDRDLNELKQEKSALQSLIGSINDRDILNFLTDEGLIPNYAFPEAGVVLKSIIYRKKQTAQADGSNYDTWVYQYERPAVSAIVELAPDNSFYAGGRRVVVDQVDMGSSDVETWRFCSSCNHSELVGTGNDTRTCPRCSDQLWSDEGQKKKMLRMRQVFATTSDRKSRIGDDSDDREPKFYNTQMLVDFDKKEVREGFCTQTDEFPFGFEFISKATFQEVNFGEKGESGDLVRIAGIELPRQGFSVCRHCGKVQNSDDDGKANHAITCKSRDQASRDNFANYLYLYRQFSTEAIRILLPVTTLAGSEEKLHSFIAALHLGLKRRFRGKIDHLQSTVYEEPISDSMYRKRFLMLYDIVPGGTGYLKELMRSSEPLMDVFQMALDSLRACVCNADPLKDGCYRCIFAYRDSYNMLMTSRNVAVELLTQILGQKHHLAKTNDLSAVPVNSLFESELEAKFIEALAHGKGMAESRKVNKVVVNGKPGYAITVGEAAYRVEPQVPLGSVQGVNIDTRADFVFWPESKDDQVLPIVVFTDGYQYHRDRIALDMMQRMAIARSGRFIVWSITWKDIDNQGTSQSNHYCNYLDLTHYPQGGRYASLLTQYDLERFRGAENMDSFVWLTKFLGLPVRSEWRTFAFVHGLLHLDIKKYASQQAVNQWQAEVRQNFPIYDTSKNGTKSEPKLYGRLEAQHLTLYVYAQEADIRQNRTDMMRVLCMLDNSPSVLLAKEFEPEWNGFLRLYNLFQFLPSHVFATTHGTNWQAYEQTSHEFENKAIPQEQADVWSEVRAMADSDAYSLIDVLQKMNTELPEVGYELVDDTGVVVASAELSWPRKRLAVLRDDEMQYARIFGGHGWQTFTFAAAMNTPRTFSSDLSS